MSHSSASRCTDVEQPSLTDTSKEGTYDVEAAKQDLQAMDIPWNGVLQHLYNTMQPVALLSGFPAGPPGYLQVLEAGTGGYGGVTFCLPRSYAIAARYRSLQGSPRPLAELKSKLVAVKMADPYSNNGSDAVVAVDNEAKILRTLMNWMKKTSTTTAPRFALLRGQSSAHTHDSKFWLAMDAIVPSITAFEPLGHLDDMHDIMHIYILHVFCGVMESLHYLHTCKPRILHQDIHLWNVMLELNDGLPKVVIMDFGSGDAIYNNASQSLESEFGKVVHMMKNCLIDCKSHPSVEEALPESWKNVLFKGSGAWEARTNRAEVIARAALKEVSVETKTEISMHLRRISRPFDDKLAAGFRNLGVLPSSDEH